MNLVQDSIEGEDGMKTRFFLIFLIVLVAQAGYTAAVDLRPGYTYWSSYKPGTMVSFRYLTTGSGSDRNIVLTVGLKSVDPDRAILVYKEVSSPDLKGSTRGMEFLIEYKSSEFARAKEDLFHGVFPVNIASEIADTEAAVEKGAEDLIVNGIRIRTDRVRNIHESSGVRNAVTLWLSDEIPGKLVKLVREIQTGSASLREEIMAADFMALPAAPDEIARLRAARKPEWVEVAALHLLIYETRFLDDMESLQKVIPEWKKTMSTLVPGAPNNDLTEFYKCLYSYQEKIGQMKTHWAEDRPSIEARLETSDKEKIRPMLDAMSRYAEELGKLLEWFDRILVLGDKSSVNETALALDKEMQDTKSESLAAARTLQVESQKLRPIKLKYLR
jgi:hypothetical protein